MIPVAARCVLGTTVIMHAKLQSTLCMQSYVDCVLSSTDFFKYDVY